MLREAADDITAFADFPPPHWRRSGRPTPSNESTKRSNAALTSSAPSPTPEGLHRLAGRILIARAIR